MNRIGSRRGRKRRSDAEAGAFDSRSEDMRELIRRRREVTIAEEVALLEKAITGADPGDPSEAEMRQVYVAAKRGRNK